MASETQPTLHERICLDLDRQLKFANNIKDLNVPISRLTARGFRVEQAEPENGEERLNFSPSFFELVHSSFLIQNTVCEHESLRSHADIGYDSGDGCSNYPIVISSELQNYVQRHVEADRQPPGDSHSDEWVTLERTCPLRWCSRQPTPPVYDYTRPFIWGWQTRDVYEDRTFKTNDHWVTSPEIESPSGKYPHMILSIHHGAKGHSRSLTKGEVKVALRVLHFRHHDPFLSKFDILPVLIVSYMTPKHGRILQAHHNGERIMFQYSPLISFEEEETAPVSLFARYEVSQPVGPTTRRACLCHRHVKVEQEQP